MPLYGGYGLNSQTQNAYEQSLKNIINQANTQLQQLQNQQGREREQHYRLQKCRGLFDTNFII